MGLPAYSSELRALSKMLKFARANVSDKMTVQQLDTLITISLEPEGIDQANLVKRADLSRSGASKNIADLTALTSRHKPGPGLVESLIDPFNRSTRSIKLTMKGTAVLLEGLILSYGDKL